MSRQPKTTDLTMPVLFLTLFLLAVQPCLAQTATHEKADRPEADIAKYDAPENDMGLYQSEWAFRLNATRRVMPEYPVEALRAAAQGVVVLSLYQDAEGRAANIKVAESPHPALTRAAVAAAGQWRWRKFVSGGVARPILSKLSFKFIIEDGEGRVEDPPDDAALRDLSKIHALRLKATWPDESSRRVEQVSPNENDLR